MLSFYYEYYTLKYNLLSVISSLKYKELDIIKCTRIQCDTTISGIQEVYSSFTSAIIELSKTIRPFGGLETKVDTNKTIARSIRATGR